MGCSPMLTLYFIILLPIGQFQYPLGRFGGEAPLVRVDGHMMTNLHGKYQRKKIGGRENVLEIIRDSQQEKTRENRRKVKGM